MRQGECPPLQESRHDPKSSRSSPPALRLSQDDRGRRLSGRLAQSGCSRQRGQALSFGSVCKQCADPAAVSPRKPAQEIPPQMWQGRHTPWLLARRTAAWVGLTLSRARLGSSLLPRCRYCSAELACSLLSTPGHEHLLSVRQTSEQFCCAGHVHFLCPHIKSK